MKPTELARSKTPPNCPLEGSVGDDGLGDDTGEDHKIKTLAKVVVGSRLHRLNTPDSDWDYRGIYQAPLKDVLSPFKNVKNTSWIEKEEK